MPPIDRILPNGIRFLAEPVAATKAAAIGFWFSRGSRDEGPQSHGITHFIEHLLFKGTSDRSARELALFFDRIGGYVNAFTERELVCVYCAVPAIHAVPAVDIVMSMLRDSVFSTVDIEKERSVIVSEILSSLDDAEEMAMDAALAAMYPGHGLSRPTGGTVEEVEKLESTRIRDEYRAYFMNMPPVVTVAGAMDAERLSSILGAYDYSGRTREQDNAAVSIDDLPRFQSGRSYPVSPFAQSQIFLARPLDFERNSAAWFSWSVINAIIGDSVSSRLFQSLREDRGLCYSVYSTFSLNRDSGIWFAYAATPVERTVETVENLFCELDSIRQQGFTDIELADARSHLAGEMILSAEDIENRMKRLGRLHFYDDTLYTIEESATLLESLENDDIQNTVRTFFSSAEESLVVYAGKRHMKECRRKWR